MVGSRVLAKRTIVIELPGSFVYVPDAAPTMLGVATGTHRSDGKLVVEVLLGGLRPASEAPPTRDLVARAIDRRRLSFAGPPTLAPGHVVCPVCGGHGLVMCDRHGMERCPHCDGAAQVPATGPAARDSRRPESPN